MKEVFSISIEQKGLLNFIQRKVGPRFRGDVRPALKELTILLSYWISLELEFVSNVNNNKVI